MDNPEILDSLFREAVSAIDAGDVTTLERLLVTHPRLVRDRLDSPSGIRMRLLSLLRKRQKHWLHDKVGRALDGFFRQPYLLWFVAEDPVRNGMLPRNIAQVARTIIQAAEREGVVSLREQLDYALCLVANHETPAAKANAAEVMTYLARGSKMIGEARRHRTKLHLTAAASSVFEVQRLIGRRGR